MNNVCAVILAAGEGKRMKSESPKVLMNVLFKPMLKWVIDAACNSGVGNICVVTGYKYQVVQNYLSTITPRCASVIQNERKGSAHAVMMAENFLRSHSGGDVLILGGDSPLISSEVIKHAYNLHKSEGNAATLISAELENPFGYGRIIRSSEDNSVKAIIEQKDANEDIKKIHEVNSGMYWFNIDALLSVLYNISNDNAQGEYYLPDAIKLFIEKGLRVNAFTSDDKDMVLGANDCVQLNELNHIARKKIIDKLIKKGINIPCDDGVIISPDTKICSNTCIMPGTIITGHSFIGQGCTIGPNSQVIESNIGNNVSFNSSLCSNSTIMKNQNVGPFACIVNKG